MSSSKFKEFSLGCLVVGSSLIWKTEKLAAMVTHCHSLSFVLIRCHSLSLIFTRCRSLYHSWSIVVSRCYSLSLVVPLIVIHCQLLSLVLTHCTIRCHSLSLDVPLAITRVTRSLGLNCEFNDPYGEKLFYSVQYKNNLLAASNLFRMFTQSIKFYKFKYHARIKSAVMQII